MAAAPWILRYKHISFAFRGFFLIILILNPLPPRYSGVLLLRSRNYKKPRAKMHGVKTIKTIIFTNALLIGSIQLATNIIECTG